MEHHRTPHDGLVTRYHAIRAASVALIEGLSAEDCMVQSAPFASPLKWHLAHTTWFFETFVLGPHADLAPCRPGWGRLFNSYYEGVGGERHPRARRGDIARPTLDEVRAWRDEVDARLTAWLPRASAAARDVVELGLQHEQQHQELMRIDGLHHAWSNPLLRDGQAPPAPTAAVRAMRWIDVRGGLVSIGAGPDGFAFDNERPRHQVFLAPFAIADRLITESEWAAFIADGGYREPRWWLSDGWEWVQRERVARPLYWIDDGHVFTGRGVRPIGDAAPVRHLSLYEADAYASWAGARLPTEAEWEHAVAQHGSAPGGDGGDAALRDAFGVAWQWTASAYAPYPGFRPLGGALGEYNGKFMVHQLVLRGSADVTPGGHARRSYRNFFHPSDRWARTGLRLARDAQD